MDPGQHKTKYRHVCNYIRVLSYHKKGLLHFWNKLVTHQVQNHIIAYSITWYITKQLQRTVYFTILGVFGFPKKSCFDQNCNKTDIDQSGTIWVNQNIWNWFILCICGHNHIPRTWTRPTKPNRLIRGALANGKWDRCLFVSIFDFCHITTNYFYSIAQMS